MNLISPLGTNAGAALTLGSLQSDQGTSVGGNPNSVVDRNLKRIEEEQQQAATKQLKGINQVV